MRTRPPLGLVVVTQSLLGMRFFTRILQERRGEPSCVRRPASVLVIVGFAVISGGEAGSPFVALVQAMAFGGLIVAACVALVLRSLLWRAIQLRAELDEVV